MKLKNILSGVACTLVLSSCNWDYHEYSNYGKDYVQETYDNVIGMVTNIYAMLDYDFGQTYSGGMLASACDEAEYAYHPMIFVILQTVLGVPPIRCPQFGLQVIKEFKLVINIWQSFRV